MSTPFDWQCSAACLQRRADLGRRLVPGGQGGVGQKPGRERRGVHDPHALLLQIRHQVGQHRVLKRVVVVREDHVQVGAVEDVAEHLHRVSADPHEPDLALFLQLPERGQCLIDDLPHLDELDVVAEHDVEVVHLHPFQADVDALHNPSWPRSRNAPVHNGPVSCPASSGLAARREAPPPVDIRSSPGRNTARCR